MRTDWGKDLEYFPVSAFLQKQW